MAVVDNVTLNRVADRNADPFGFLLDIDFNTRLIDETKAAVKEDIWAWFLEHQGEELLTVRVAIVFTKTVHVRDVRKLIEWIAGANPFDS